MSSTESISTQQKAKSSKELKLFLQAENARLADEAPSAIALYNDFIKEYKHNATAHYNLARLQLQKSDRINAEKNALKAFKLDKDNHFFEEFYIKTLMANRKSKKAEEAYTHILSKYPNVVEYRYGKAVLHVITSEYQKAIQEFDLLEKQMGFDEDIVTQKKNLYLRMGDYSSAIHEIRKLKGNEFGTPKYDIMIADIYEENNQSEKAKEIYTQIEKEYPYDPMAQVALARYYLDGENKPGYNQYMKLVMGNKNLDVEKKIAIILPTLRKLESDSLEREEIIGMAKIISDESPTNQDALSLYADVLYFSKKNDEALKAYQKLLVFNEHKFNTWSQIISIFSESQLHDSVIYYSKKCQNLFPNNAVPSFYAGISHLQLKQTDSAIVWLEKAADSKSDNDLLNTQVLSSLGDAYNTAKLFSKSDSCFEAALILQPNEASTLNNYAYYLSLRKEKLEIAEQMSKKSLMLQPQSKSFLDTYGWILFQQGNYKEALIYIQKSIDADGQGDGTLYEHLGDVYYKLNEVEKAKLNWLKAKELGEQSPLLLKKINEGIYYE
ncbi:MAG: tetratricopeptide repeat protein [Bacteroidetes bacterium]|nr:tetratricopeptide repeat protein [Bacteroidota bacterium]